IDLVGEIWRDVDRGVGDDQRILVTGDIHHKAMADAPRCANARLARDYGTHQLVRVQAALHQRLGLPSRTSSTAFAAESWLYIASFTRKPDMSSPVRPATLRTRSGGPTRIGAIRPSLAASTAPLRETSSHGCATAVVTGGRPCASTRNPSQRPFYGVVAFSTPRSILTDFSPPSSTPT